MTTDLEAQCDSTAEFDWPNLHLFVNILLRQSLGRLVHEQFLSKTNFF